jgi:putative acetyltransferase
MTGQAALCLRPAVTADAVALAEVYATAVLSRGRGHYGPRELAAWAAQGSAARFAAMLADPAKRLLAAELDRRLVGLAGLEGDQCILLYAAPTAPPGTGTALLAAVEALARDRGLAVLSLTASRNAVPFYLRRGYAILTVASRPLPGGVALPVCLMAKELAGLIHE